MAIRYGALRGRVDRYKREDHASTPHLQVRIVDQTGQPWRAAVNVESDDDSDVVYWVVDPLTAHPILDGLDALPTGFTSQPPDSRHALDYLNAPLFDLALGRVLPPSGTASADHLQDMLSLYLDHCKAADGEIFAFGAKFTQNEHKLIDTEFGNTDGRHGVHDIHLNQGNRGAHEADNGAFRDGGLVLRYAGRHVGIFLAFQTQRVPTDATGFPVMGSRPLGAVIGHPGPTTVDTDTDTDTDISIAQPLINPVGIDPGHEIIVLANLPHSHARSPTGDSPTATDTPPPSTSPSPPALPPPSRSTAPESNSAPRAGTSPSTTTPTLWSTPWSTATPTPPAKTGTSDSAKRLYEAHPVVYPRNLPPQTAIPDRRYFSADATQAVTR